MPKSAFRIIAFKCLKPEMPIQGDQHFVNRMQRSLSKEDRWYKFYQQINISKDGNTVTIPNDFYDDGIEEIFNRYNSIMAGKALCVNEKEWKRYSYVTSIVGDEYLRSTLERVMKRLEKYVI